MVRTEFIGYAPEAGLVPVNASYTDNILWNDGTDILWNDDTDILWSWTLSIYPDASFGGKLPRNTFIGVS